MGRPKYLNDRLEGRSNHQLEGLTKKERHLLSNSGPPLRPERSLWSQACLQMASLTERPRKSTTSDSDPTSPTGVRKNPAHCSSSTSATRADWDQPTRDAPLRKDQGTNRESKARRISQTTIPGTIPCTPTGIVLCNHPDTNNVVGTDIFLYSIVGAYNSHTKRPTPTCF